jgi:hypothetical protein
VEVEMLRRLRPSALRVVPAVLLGAAVASAQSPAPGVRAHVERLASEAFGGRQAGSEGERLAAEYIASELEAIGARPLPGRASPFDPFEFTAGSRDGGSRVGVLPAGAASPAAFAEPADVQALSFSENATAGGDAVFAGYGIVVPESQNFGYDSFAGLDIAGKVVVVLRYFPEDAEPATRALLARYSALRYKAMAARQRGAAALLVVTGPRSPNAGRTIPMGFDTALAGSGVPAASVSGNVAAALFTGARSLREVQEELDSGNPHVAGFPLPVRVTLETSVVRETRTARNVLAYLPATGSVDTVDKPWIVVGAHYDHLGRGEHGNSLASGEEAARAHVGADDNASGTAAVLGIADRLSRRPRSRHVLLALWSAEEIGLVGSNAFASAPPVPVDRIAAYLNYDMVGRMTDNRLTIQAVGTSAAWPAILERVNVAAGFDVVLQPDPYQPTDVATFNQAGIPSLSFTTGAHVDYHKPSDTADKINYEDLDRVAVMGAAIVGRLMADADPPQFVRIEPSAQTASRAGIRVFTGTVPDYTSTDPGLLLGGVVAGGPADKAGLVKGDVIVEIAGHSITNIYDYTYALDLLKVDEPVTVVYRRGGERRETMLTPGARP